MMNGNMKVALKAASTIGGAVLAQYGLDAALLSTKHNTSFGEEFSDKLAGNAGELGTKMVVTAICTKAALDLKDLVVTVAMACAEAAPEMSTEEQDISYKKKEKEGSNKY